MKIAFHSSYLGYRGTEIALMDYARGNQEVLGNQSFFLMPWREGEAEHPVALRMREIAPLRFYRSVEEREAILNEDGADFFYCIKNGFNDGAFSKKVPTGIHAIFRESEFHGDAYAYVSPWLSEVMAYGKAPWVPHMVRLAEDDGDLRMEDGGQRPEGGGRRSDGGGQSKDSSRWSVVGGQWSDLRIPKEATVFGRHGGDDSFDIPWVQEAVVEIARKSPDVWFLFLNTRQFPGAQKMPNIRFLPPTADPILKRRFLNTCDAMLHGRMRGETFGLSCLEFAMLGKPVLTYANSPERAHLEILGDAAVAYENAQHLRALLRDRGRWSDIGSLGAEGRGQRTEDGGRLSVVGSRKSVVSGRRSKTDRQPTTGNRQPLSMGRSKEYQFKNYQPEAVMRKFEQVFLK
jgi:hypothetical protein